MPTFKTIVIEDETVNATGVAIPATIVETLGAGKRPKVTVALNGYTYRTTLSVYGGTFVVPLAKVHREAAGVTEGQQVDVTLELDTAPREVDVPADLVDGTSVAQSKCLPQWPT